MITPVFVRLLGASQYGEYAVMMSILGMLMIAVNGGGFDGIRKYISEDRPTRLWTENVFGFYTRVGGVLSAVAILAILFAVLSGAVDRVFGSDFRPYFYLLCLLVLSVQLYQIGRGTLMGLGRETYSEPFVVVHKALFGVFAVAFAWIGYGVGGVLVGYLLSTVVCAVGVFLLVRRYLPLESVTEPVRPRFPRRELLSFNGLSIVLVLLMTSLYHVDVLLLQPIAGSEQTGHYKAALVVAEFLWFAPFAVQLLLLQGSSQLWSTNQVDRITRIAGQVTRYTVLLTLLLMLGIAALANEFVGLYFGAEFAPAVVPLLLLLPGALGFAVVRPILAIGQGRGELRVLIVATGVAAGANLLLNVVLIPLYGMYGAAVATSVSYGSMFVFHVWSARWIGFDPLDDLQPRAIALTVLVSAPLVFGFASLFQSPVYALLAVPPFGFTVFVTVAIATGAVRSEELRMMVGYLPIDPSRPGRLSG
jgi:O-antigen/teichoic acid export membrane protein